MPSVLPDKTAGCSSAPAQRALIDSLPPMLKQAPISSKSLRVYVACGGDANAAAERLCQHPNSVRNRVNRARAVLAMEDATDKQLFAYLSMIFL